ncbi:hypothetical protein [Streptomyces griseosporeus]
MNLSLFPVSVAQVDDGWNQVIALFRAAKDVAEAGDERSYCDLGEEGEIVRDLLVRAHVGQVNARECAEMAVSGGEILGDDAGTVCAVLAPGDVARVDQFLSHLDVREVMLVAPEVLSGVIRGAVPEEYLEDISQCLTEMRDIYSRAARTGSCVAQIYEG